MPTKMQNNFLIRAVLLVALLFSVFPSMPAAQAQTLEDCIAVNASLDVFTSVGESSTFSVSPGNAQDGTLEVSAPSWLSVEHNSSSILTLTVTSDPTNSPTYSDAGSIVVWARNWSVPDGSGGLKDCEDRSASVRKDFVQNQSGSGTCGISISVSPETVNPGEGSTIIIQITGNTTFPIVPGNGVSANAGVVDISLPGSTSPGSTIYGTYTAPSSETVDYVSSGSFYIDQNGVLVACNSAQARVAVQRQCPSGYVYAYDSDIVVGGTTTVSAPAGWTGGSFTGYDSNVITVGMISGNSATATGVSNGAEYISGTGWTAQNGAQNCSLYGTVVTVGSGEPLPPGTPWGVVDALDCVVTAPATDCATNVVWSTDEVTAARIYVSVNSGTETLFSSSLSCSGSTCPYAGMVVGSTYDFNLYDYSSGSLVLLDTVRATASSTPPASGPSPSGDISASDDDPDSSANCVTAPPETSCNVDISWTTTDIPQRAAVFYSKDGGALQYFGCGETGTNEPADIEAGSSYEFKLYSSSDCVSLGSSTLGDVILLWDDLYGSIPSGWTCISCDPGDAFYQKFPRASNSYSGTGGSDTVTHTASVTNTSAESGSSSYATGGSSGSISSAGHTHNWGTITVTPGSVVPNYKHLKVIKKSNPSVIPANAIAVFDASVPSGWTRYTSLDSTYLRGGEDNSTGGSGSHVHNLTGSTTSTSGTVSYKTPNSTGRPNTFHSHSINVDTAASPNNPPYINVVFGKVTADSAVPSNMIAFFDSAPNSSWSTVSGVSSSYYQRFLVGSSAFGATGGVSTHDHSGSVVTTGAAATGNTNVSTTCPCGQAAGFSHTHDVTLSISSASSLPAYRDVILGQYTGAVLLDSVTVSARTPTPPSAPATAVVYNSPSGVPGGYSPPPCGQVLVKWDTVSSVDGYRIYVYDSSTGALAAPYKQVSGQTSDYTFVVPPSTDLYNYKVSAYSGSLESSQTLATNSPVSVSFACGDPLLITSTKSVVAIHGTALTPENDFADAGTVLAGDDVEFRIRLTNTGDEAIASVMNLTDTMENLSEPDGGWDMSCSSECTAAESSYDEDTGVLVISVTPNGGNALDQAESWDVTFHAVTTAPSGGTAVIFRSRNNVVIPFGAGTKSTPPFIVWRSQTSPVIREIY